MKRFLLFVGLTTLVPTLAQSQVIVNEYNAVSADEYIAPPDSFKPYEGFDYGILPYSGNNGAAQNPFPTDVDSVTPGNQIALPNGWDGSTGWGRVRGNGGDWLELVVTTDHLDMTGWTFYWENDDTDASGNEYPSGVLSRDGIVGDSPGERGFFKLTDDPFWSDLRAGTIITITESDSFVEINENGSTGHVYDLSTDLSFNPLAGDWHVNIHADETLLDAGTDTQYFKGFSDIKVDNDEWRIAIFDDTNTSLESTVEAAGNRASLDLTTGLVGEFVGESTDSLTPPETFGFNTGAGGVGNDELGAFLGDPTLNGTSETEDYEDVDFSTFGTENLYNANFIESTLTGVQDFSALRDWLGMIGDYDDDGTVGQDDLNLVLDNWGAAASAGNAPDVDWINDEQITAAIIGQDELARVLQNWGNTSAIVAELGDITDATGLTPDEVLELVPEPTSLALLTIGGLALAGRRRSM